MKTSLSFCALLFSVFYAFILKQTPLSHGAVIGTKPAAAAVLNASEVEAFMGKKTRISATIKGKVIKVTKSKGGWFELDAGKGKSIIAHFKEYNVTIPSGLKGHNVIVEGVAEKQFIADDSQHLAGEGKQHGGNTNPKQKLIFEATGLMVE